MERITDVIFGIFASLFTTLFAACIPIQSKNYLLWKLHVTAADMIGEAYGISPELTSILIGLIFGLIVYLGLWLNRRIR